jgi:23S rRNA A1618 N6-methylase RlmF
MLLYTFIHNLLNVLVQIANEMEFKKKLRLPSIATGVNCFYFLIPFLYTTTWFGPYGPSSGGKMVIMAVTCSGV